jgi:hypothetical protein
LNVNSGTISHPAAVRVIDERRVRPVHQAVRLAAAPPCVDRDRDLEDRRDAAQLREPDRLDTAALEARDGSLTQPGRARDIDLSQVSVLPDGTEEPPDTEFIHGGIVAGAGHLRLIG